MKVLLVTGNYLPGKNGGIENYAHWVAKTLLQNNFEVQVAALNVQEKEDYIYDGLKVNYLKCAISVFENLLQREEFDICHFHEYSQNGIEIPWFETSKRHCAKVFFTFHLPYLTCYKSDFRYKGIEDCNTFSDSKRCTSCVIADKMGYRHFIQPELFLTAAQGLLGIFGGKKMLERRIIGKYRDLDKLISICDNLFIYADWFKTILSENGYDLEKIKKIPYKTKSETLESSSGNRTLKYKILFVGRIQHQKGLHLLCKAMNKIDSKNISLDVYGNIVDQDYFNNCKKEYSFNFKGTTNYVQLLKELKAYDFLVLPSVFTEMFSLIIKDAFYEQLPVIGSTAKGNMDAITDGVNGFLFQYDDANDLAEVIDKAYRLRKEGWEPVFEYPESPEKDVAEIISYYSLSKTDLGNHS